MDSAPFFISVIIPVYNGEALLKDAVASIQCQNHLPMEIIVVDDGSTDGTERVAKSLEGNIHYIYQANKGAPAARNTGLKTTRGDVISFLDADDLWTERKLEVQLAHLARDPSVEIVLGYTQCVRFVETGEGDTKFEKHQDSWPALSLGAAVFRKSAFDKIGLLDEDLPYNDDVDWYLRARELRLRMVIHQNVVQYYRRHERNMTNEQGMTSYYFCKVLKRSIDRRRRFRPNPVEPALG